MPVSPVRAAIALLLLAVAPSSSHGATRAGAVQFTGTHASDRSLRSVESGLLRSGLPATAGVLSRTGLHLFVADSEGAWNGLVADGLNEALEEGPEAVARFAESLPPSIAQAGPDIEGGVLRFTLPDGRGEGLLAVYLPDLLDRSGKDLGRLNSTVPNEGLYVSGVSVDRARGDEPSFRGMYLPARPKGLTRGRVPDVNLRELPGGGLGDLTIWRGKGATGDDGESLGKELRKLLRSDAVDAGSLRDFPKGKDDLVRSLQTSRSEQEVLVIRDDWYSTVAGGPDTWTTSTARSAHPSRYVAFSAPVALSNEDGERVGTVVLGGVAFYTPLMLDPEEARRYTNKSAQAFYGSVARGEVAFFKDGDRVFFLRGHLDQWRAGKDRQRRGRAWSTRDVPDRIKQIAGEVGSRKISKAAGRPMPMRFEPSPSSGDGVPVARGRVHDGDLAQWLRHWDKGAELDGGAAVFSLASASGGALFESSFDLGGEPEARPSSGEGPLLEIADVYPLEPTCTPGQQVLGVVEFVIDRIPEGEEAELELEWAVSAGGPALAKFSASLMRVAGEHEVLIEAGCPSNGSVAELSVELRWGATGLSVTGASEVRVRP